jgi:predicted Zn-dependent protease
MVRTAYAKLASEQAALLLDHNYTPEAEQTYRLATEIRPSLPEAVFGYVKLLVQQNRFEDAIPVVESAINASAENQQFRDLLDQVQKKLKN